MSDIKKRLDIKASIIENCEPIAFGSETELMREAIERIKELEDISEGSIQLIKELNELAYHKEGVSYKSMFTYSMNDAPIEVEKLKQQLKELEIQLLGISEQLAERDKALEWQDISSAPKDGSKFDVWWEVGDQSNRAVNCEWSKQFGIVCKHGCPQIETIVVGAKYFRIIRPPQEALTAIEENDDE